MFKRIFTKANSIVLHRAHFLQLHEEGVLLSPASREAGRVAVLRSGGQSGKARL